MIKIETRDRGPVWVNPDQICTVRSVGLYTEICTMNQILQTDEVIEDVLILIIRENNK